MRRCTLDARLASQHAFQIRRVCAEIGMSRCRAQISNTVSDRGNRWAGTINHNILVVDTAGPSVPSAWRGSHKCC